MLRKLVMCVFALVPNYAVSMSKFVSDLQYISNKHMEGNHKPIHTYIYMYHVVIIYKELHKPIIYN